MCVKCTQRLFFALVEGAAVAAPFVCPKRASMCAALERAGVCLTSLLQMSNKGVFCGTVTYYAQCGHRLLPNDKKGLLATFPSAGSRIPWQDIEKTSNRPKVGSRAENLEKRRFCPKRRLTPLGYRTRV